MIFRSRWVLISLIKLTVASLSAIVYFYVVVPYIVKMKAVEKAEAEADRAVEDLDQLRRKQTDFKQQVRRSLPAGPEYKDDPKRARREYADVAKQEYEQALNKVLRDSGARNTTVNFVDAVSNDKAGIPLIDPKGKAPGRDDDPTDFFTYIPVVFKIDIPKADLDTVTEVLRRYYALDLLHQITHLSVKPVGGGDLGEDKRPQKDRNDLKVELTTRAIIVHGADRRLSLTPAPMPLAGLGGGLVATAYENNSRADLRKPLPTPLDPLLANNPPRDYHLIAGKDVFHGSLPEFKPPPPPPGPGPPPVVPPKPDYREYIYYTTNIHKIFGDEHTLEITIKDKINKEDYELILTQVGEKVVVKSYKYEYQDFKLDAAQRKKKVYSQDTLEISKYTMINKNNFTVYGVDADGSLILGEKPTGLSPDLSKDDKNPPRPGGGGSPRVALPPPDPKAAVIGGLVVTAPKAEKFYRWSSGTNLKQIVELTKADAEKAIKRAQTRFLPTATSDAANTPDPGR